VNAPLVEEMRAFEGPDLLHFLGHKKEKNKLKNTSRIFSISTALKSFLITEYKLDKAITVIPNCINPDKEIPSVEEVEKMRNTLQIQNKISIGFVGSIFPYHGVDQLLLAFELLIKHRKDIKLIVVGGGALKEKLEQRAINTLPADSFIFTGKVPHSEVMRYIGAFDIAVMPSSNWYGSPVKVLEYGLMMKPIVAPNNGPLNDIITNNVEGLLVNSGVDNLVNGLNYCIENKEMSMNMSTAFHNKIMKQYTWKKQAEQILSRG
jgi:glycosyltransferase involved in cell wall biosynthesis